MEIVPCPRCDAPMQQEEGVQSASIQFWVCPVCGCRQINNIGTAPIKDHTPDEEKEICAYALKRSEEIRQAELVSESFCWQCGRYYVEGCFIHFTEASPACSRFKTSLGGTS